MTQIISKIPKRLLPHIVAHRGFHCTKDRTDRPLENTIAAYERAWSMGMTHAECDVVMTKDAKLMLNHDENFTRLAMFPRRHRVKKQPAKLTARDILSGCVTKNGVSAPFLSHVLDIAAAFGPDKKLVIEMKPGAKSTADCLLKFLVDHPKFFENISVIMSFDRALIHAFGKRYREVFPRQGGIKLLFLLVPPEEEGVWGDPYESVPVGQPRLLEEMLGPLDGFYFGFSATYTSIHKEFLRNT